MAEPLPARVRANEERRAFRARLARGSLGCPRRPISCGHMLADHGGRGWDGAGSPVDPSCTVPGCDCDGVS